MTYKDVSFTASSTVEIHDLLSWTTQIPFDFSCQQVWELRHNASLLQMQKEENVEEKNTEKQTFFTVAHPSHVHG